MNKLSASLLNVLIKLTLKIKKNIYICTVVASFGR